MSVFDDGKPPNRNDSTVAEPSYDRDSFNCNSDHRQFRHHNHHHRQLPSLMSNPCYPITLKFVDVCYKVKVESNGGGNLKRMICGRDRSRDNTSTARIEERVILNGITGMASPGEILAVLGPSGSGKSTLLNALAGRIHGHSLTGSILLNDKNLTRSNLKRVGFVPQDDVLYPHLTVRETLVYCALLRLPNSLSKSEKITVADSVLTELGLSKCGDTIIGNAFIRGVSGGERKRVSIAHEMLINPSLLILDEPTSGLDATAAFRLVATLEGVARKGRRTVAMSVHQPSSRVFQMFNAVLVMAEGREIYFGKGSEAMGYFESVGFSPCFPMNPADFLLDLANGVCHFDGSNDRDKTNMKQTLFSSYNNVLGPRVRAACLESSTTTMVPKEMVRISSYTHPKQHLRTHISTWLNQFTILLQRSLKERRHESFNSLRVSQVIAAAILAGSIWWHSDYRDIQDRLGLLFFMAIFWGVFPSFNAVFAFPQDRAIFSKERSSGMYPLSPYFIARIVGDLPMELILPIVFLTLVYWMSSLRPELWAFTITLAILLGYVLVAQGLGLALGAIIMDAKRASTIVTIIMLAFVLIGGFYVHKLPNCLNWVKYTSVTFHFYRLLIYVQYGQGQVISTLFGCSSHGGNLASCKFIQEDIEGQISPILNIGVLLVSFVGFRLLAYFALRRMKV